MTQWPARLVLVGAGKMGGAMAQGWLDAGLAASSLTILEPKPSPEIASLAARKNQPPPKLIMPFHTRPIIAVGTSTVMNRRHFESPNSRAASSNSFGKVISE